MFPDETLDKAARLIASCEDAGVLIASVESCSGGLIAGCLISVAGSSAVFERGFVTYSNEAKMEVVGVPQQTLAAHGAVSPETAIAMADGALDISPADLSVGVTGVAGPGGGTPEKPVGTVAIAVARRGRDTVCQMPHFAGDRMAVRLATVDKALDMMLAAI
ncbi:MAG: CinA family protein [Rhodospirillales bacterium]|jgi:nicotinamide-nucleotide amidase|nr:damage-inducible protein CinA [Rhodospirillaceae bacterium]MDP6430093.1 CinA family protein [Rhodospirillales bacterium]MDP6643093.1 CinA family protein [Rhodospirillales bacterium]MDP6841994.1 CinA family protein [Rhodospirillales bacterium]|tara:strand:+ start:3268 stop:3753 length:486 start_codon:yes stop_codon:yes gene_type:complete